jgi:hypothetical protein
MTMTYCVRLLTIPPGLPQVLQDRLQHSSGEQPFLTKRIPPFHNPCLTRAIQTCPTSALGQAAEMGHEQ